MNQIDLLLLFLLIALNLSGQIKCDTLIDRSFCFLFVHVECRTCGGVETVHKMFCETGPAHTNATVGRGGAIVPLDRGQILKPNELDATNICPSLALSKARSFHCF
jgi:hypothetical protein